MHCVGRMFKISLLNLVHKVTTMLYEQGHVAHMIVIRNAYKICHKAERKIPLGRP